MNPIEAAFREGYREAVWASPMSAGDADAMEHSEWLTSTARAHPYGPRIPGPPTEEGVWWCEVEGGTMQVVETFQTADGLSHVGRGGFLYRPDILAHYAAPVVRPT